MLRNEERVCVEVRRWCNQDDVSTTCAYLNHRCIGPSELTSGTTTQIDITKVRTLRPMGQQSHRYLEHIIRHGLAGTAVRTGLFGIQTVPFAVVDEGRIVAEDLGVELEFDAVGVGDGQRLCCIDDRRCGC